MNELENYLHHYFCIDTADCKQLGALFKEESYKKGDYYLKTGKYCNKLSFI